MCGIAGYDFSDNTRTPTGLPQRLIEALKHRGPDDDGVQQFERTAKGLITTEEPNAPIALVHTRLSIIDLSAAGAEPMTNETGRLWLTFNGEIYNFPQLREALQQLGHVFRSSADAEVIIHGYEAWGDSVVTRLRGMFAFALFDMDRDRWFCARDSFGIKPFVYSHKPCCFSFASDLNALRLVPGVNTQIDDAALAQYLALGYVPAPYTIATGVHKLERGHMLVVEQGKLQLRQYEIAPPKRRIYSFDEAVSSVLDTVVESVAEHLVADVPVSCFLSGGIDSSLVAAVAAKNGARPTCFTMGFGDQNFDERPHAKNIAQALELPWQSGLATADDIRKKLVEIPQTFDEPFADSSAAPTMLVAALARQQFKVVLSGDGGDELFLGYNRYRLFSLAERAARAPAGVRRAASEIAARLPSQLVDRLYHGARRLGHLPQIQHPSRKLLAVTQTLVEDDRIALYADTLRISGRRVLSHIYGNSEAIALSALRRAALKAPEAPAQLFASAIDEETYLPEDILTKVDRSTMAVGLEARVPLLDPRVRSVARATSARLHCQQGGKNVLRSALNQVLPAHLTSRPKQGFSIPLASWLRGPLLQEMQGCASDSRLGDLGLSLREIDILGQEHSSGKADHGNALWALMCLRSYLARVDGP